MKSALETLVGPVLDAAASKTLAAELRQATTETLPAFVEGVEGFTRSLSQLRDMLTATRPTSEGDFVLGTWRAEALPELRRLRDEITAVEHVLVRPTRTTFVKPRRTGKKKRMH